MNYPWSRNVTYSLNKFGRIIIEEEWSQLWRIITEHNWLISKENFIIGIIAKRINIKKLIGWEWNKLGGNGEIGKWEIKLKNLEFIKDRKEIWEFEWEIRK